MATNSLGDFDFITIDAVGGRGGTPQTVKPQAALIQRPGVNGTGFVLTGIKGVPFQMQSIVDVDTFANAQAGVVTYEQACNTELKVLIQNGADYSADPVFNQYWINDVQATVRRISVSVGGLIGGAQAVVEAIWTLTPVYVEE